MIIINKNIPKFHIRIIKDYLDWLSIQFIAILLFTLALEKGYYLGILWAIFGLIHVFRNQYMILFSISISGENIILKFYKYNSLIVHKFQIKDFEITDKSGPIGKTYKFISNKFTYKLKNNYYWKGKEMKELLNKFENLKKIN